MDNFRSKRSPAPDLEQEWPYSSSERRMDIISGINTKKAKVVIGQKGAHTKCWNYNYSYFLINHLIVCL